MMHLRSSRIVQGYGLMFAIRSYRAWWYSAWLRTLARFSRTQLGSFWLGLSNLLSVALLGSVYSIVLKVPNPGTYVIYLGFGLTIWSLISLASVSGSTLFVSRRDQLVNNSIPAIFYCLEEWSFQLQTFFQAFLVILLSFSFLSPVLLVHAFSSIWLPLLNLCLFSLCLVVLTAVVGSRFKDFSQLLPIFLQLLFLVSPILYPREGLGNYGLIADYNPLYFILAALRDALVEGTVNISQQLFVALLNICAVCLSFALLKSLRHRLPLWV